MSQLDNAFTCHGWSWADYCMVCEQELAEQHAKENELCPECNYYLWDTDSVPLNNCNSCGRKLING